ncbi:MAG: 4-hydroxybenzoate octaprenyltransferase [Candidatus Liberibacter europaeus]|uniref:4-hydroxybenzoate octaprenyltransferase n=1 Tax=Candidatus Liberibacter europaeus TaxID=744859 RepID=A0A2T4VXB0_9HYPH|nr:4-hydroxybenzoate octaprenyltransferase [Candidatus Liberibacter europaeus]PTL86410.1 MAG: 4-hydroxybenzoate octaprenyltransferase [Candidatus Liberibacter europaeus]
MFSLCDYLRRRIVDSAIYPYVQLARWDRPTGWRLLAWPCLWSIVLAAHSFKRSGILSWSLVLWYIFLCIIGSIVMRGAGCTWNDLVDQNIDLQVYRTQSRPLPSGRCSRLQAYIFAFLQLLIGFIVLIKFNYFTIFLGCMLLAIVILYPFTKRLINYPQIVLGFCFSGGILVGWSALYGTISWVTILLYIGTICWVIGYDTIYAHQDKEDDELIGLGSTARFFGHNTKLWLFFLYGMFILLFMFVLYFVHVNICAWIGMLVVLYLLVWQIVVLDTSSPDKCFIAFKKNDTLGMLIFLGLIMSLLLIN